MRQGIFLADVSKQMECIRKAISVGSNCTDEGSNQWQQIFEKVQEGFLCQMSRIERGTEKGKSCVSGFKQIH